MPGLIRYRRSLLVILSIICCAFVFIKCEDRSNTSKSTATVAFTDYAGAEACARCHMAEYRDQTHTSHFLTSQKAAISNIKGSFTAGKNIFMYNPGLYIAAEQKGDSLFQVQYEKGIKIRALSFDITVGSGKRGQTYAYWDHEALFQLPVSYFASVDEWANSPGFSNKVIFNRPISARCLECHSTYFVKLPEKESGDGPVSKADEFSKQHIVYGVTCEKCHGPGARHVAYHTQHPDDKVAQFIIANRKFTRLQSLDMCRLCHGGRLSKTKPPFSFMPGDSLSSFFETNTPPVQGPAIDVHGNQYGMLAASRCFNKTQMTCLTCHDSHKSQVGDKLLFSQKCQTCHQPDNHPALSPKPAFNIANNCIDCHMPEQTSHSIMMLQQGQSVPTAVSMRSHYITIYPDETKKVLGKRQ